jgi:phospholipid/cholesterol/gamma-HCH transport system substrate-binding protein
MNWLAAPEFKVGLLVLVVSGIIAGMSLRLSNDPSYLGASKEAWFYIDDASGLVKSSNVTMSGINVGIIHDIKLENGQAKVEMVLQGTTPVTKSARIEIRPNGILGDKHVEVVAGDPRDPPLRSGEQILVVDDRASVDRLIAEVSKITKSLSAVAENIRSATDGDTDKPLGRIINNIETITTDLAQISRERKDEVGEIIEDVHAITGTINDIVNDEGPEGLKQSLRGALKSMRRIEVSLKNVEDITGKINRGEGTIGKLVNDETTVEEVNSAVNSINSYLDAANKLQTSVDFHSNYVMNGMGAKSFLSLKLQPGLDRYYEVGLVDDPLGVTEHTVTTTDANGNTQIVKEDKRYLDRVKFNALFAKNFYDFTIKGGVMENSGGVGADYHMFKRRLRLSVDAFDFTSLNLRAWARYTLYSGVYLTAGGEDILSKTGRASGFVGAGIYITNDDLKLLLSKAPF